MEYNLLTPHQKRLLEFASKEKNITDYFYLTGGTALSYFYFKHRFSEDLDFFSEKEYDLPQVLFWVKTASIKLSCLKVEQETLRGQDIFYFHFQDHSFVKVDFAYFPFAPLGKWKRFNNLKVSSAEDIAVNKLQAIMTRKKSRDYLDLYVCLDYLKWNWQNLQKMYRVKYDVNLSFEQLATSFTNIVDSSDLPRFLGNFKWKIIEDFFLQEAKKLKKEVLT